MATRFQMEFTLAHPVEAVRRVMCDLAIIEAWETTQGALKVEIREQEDGCEIKVVRHAVTVNGIDESKTQTVTTIVQWDPEAQIRRWRWMGSAIIGLSGEDQLIAAGKKVTKLRLSATASANVPALGQPMEKRIRAGFEATWPAYVDLLKRHLGK